MDAEQQTSLLTPSPEDLASVKVFPLIPALKKDVIVSLYPVLNGCFHISFRRLQLVSGAPLLHENRV